MRILDKKKLLLSIIFSVFIFLISSFILKKIINNTIEENASEQLMNANNQNMEIAQVKIKTILDSKIDIFIENLLDSHAIEEEIVDSEQLVDLLKYYRKENFIATLGVVVGDREVFIDENDEVIKIDKDVLESILVNEKSIFKILINGEEQLVVKNTLNDGNRQDITVIYLHKDKTENKELYIPVYTEEGFSYVIDNDGQIIFYSTKDKSQVDLENLFDRILSFSDENLDSVNKARIDIFNNKSGIVRYEKSGDEGRWMSYAPLGIEDLYLCTIIPNNIMERNVDEIKNLNKMFMIVILVDIVLLITFFKFLEFNEKKKDEKIKLKIEKELLDKKIQAQTDPLTKLLNRLGLENQIKNLIENTYGKSILIMFDLDNFKLINDKLGHPVGDEVLRIFSECLKSFFDEDDFICRIAGDEFIVFIDNYIERDVLEDKLKNLIKKIHKDLSEYYIKYKLSTSIGVVYVDKKIDTYKDVYTRVDCALYKAKKLGKDTFYIE